jgi:nitrite reductase/ring-hydroxylating ferredoxin subunit
MEDHVVAKEAEFSENERIIVQLKGREIAVFNVDGEYHAYTNWCAHQSGPICEGELSGTSEATFDPETLELELEWGREDEILNCPWHGWEYDVTTGECLSRKGIQLPEYPVRVEDDEIIVTA